MAGAAEMKVVPRMDAESARRLCDDIRADINAAGSHIDNARRKLLSLYEGAGWLSLGYDSFRECAAKEFDLTERTLYRRLEEAKVVRELEATFATVAKVETKENIPDPATIPIRQMGALAKAPEGARAEVLDVAATAAGGKPSEAMVQAAVEAKKAAPDASPAELVKAVVEAKPKKPKAVVPEVVEEVREERAEQAAKEADLTDEEWLSSLPLTSKLSGHILDKFRRDALDYRDFESTVPSGLPLRAAIAEFHKRTKKRQKGRVPYRGFVASRADLILSVEHPKSWFPCPPTSKGGCDGTGTVPTVGDCPMCRGRGYLPR